MSFPVNSLLITHLHTSSCTRAGKQHLKLMVHLHSLGCNYQKAIQ